MSDKTIFVVVGVDSHLPRIEKCISSIRLLYRDKFDIGVATFGNSTVPPSKKLQQYCQENELIFFDSERQDFLNLDPARVERCGTTPSEVKAVASEFHVCEMVGNLEISKHFYDLGYEEVYLLHSDVLLVRDFLPLYRKYKKSKWAFVSALLTHHGAPTLKFSEISDHENISKGFAVVGSSRVWVRCAQAILMINKELVNVLYSKYTSQKEIYDSVFSRFSMFGDVALVQMCTLGIEGFFGNPVREETMVDASFTLNCFDRKVFLKNSLTHIHGMTLFDFYFDSIEEIIKSCKK